MKRTILSMIAVSGGFSPFRLAHRHQALIVTYHRFGTAAPDAIAAEMLETQLAYLTRRYHVVPLSWLARRLARGDSLQPGTAAVTVDDGYDDVHAVALPIFRRHNVPATVFAVSGFLDDRCWIWTDKTRYVLGGTAEPRIDLTLAGTRVQASLPTPQARRAAAARINRVLKSLPDEAKEAAIESLAVRLAVTLPRQAPAGMRPMTWDEARALVAAGLDIGSHTVTHPMLTQVDGARLVRELTESRARLRDELSVPITLFCYPNGGCNAQVRDAVAQAGYDAAVSTIPGFNDARTDRYALRRIHTEGDLAHFIQSTSGFEQVKARLRALRARTAPPQSAVATS